MKTLPVIRLDSFTDLKCDSYLQTASQSKSIQTNQIAPVFDSSECFRDSRSTAVWQIVINNPIFARNIAAIQKQTHFFRKAVDDNRFFLECSKS